MIELKKDEYLDIAGPFGNLTTVITPCSGRPEHCDVLIMTHGFRGSMEGGGRAVQLAAMASKLLHVVRYNFTNNSQLLSRQILELEAVIRFVKEKYPCSRIILLGRSMGGAASLVAAAKDKSIKGLILWAAPNNLEQTFLQALGSENYNKLAAGEYLYLNDERGEVTLEPLFVKEIKRFNLGLILKQWKNRPLLFIHGSKDEVVCVEQAQASFALAGLPKKLIVIQNADHSFTNHSNKAAEEVVAWLETIL